MIVRPKRVSGNAPSPSTNRNISLISLRGRGVFVSLSVVKVGGTNDASQVTMEIDGVNVVGITYMAALGGGLGTANNSGIVATTGSIGKCISVQFNEPLYFARGLKINFHTSSDANINNVVANAVIGDFVANPIDGIVHFPETTKIAAKRKK